jgi:polyhydroxybutyrate depolymerase
MRSPATPIRYRAPVLALLGALLLGSPLQAQTLRERLQERMAERSAQRDTPSSANLQEFVLEHGGLQRRYLLYVPARLSASQAVPLVLAFHGCGGHA